MKDDKISKVRGEVDQLKDVMIRSIDKVLERGEKIELLVDKTETLEEHAFKFKKQAKSLKNRLWWKNIRLTLIILCILALVIYGILAVSCGGPKLPKC